MTNLVEKVVEKVLDVCESYMTIDELMEYSKDHDSIKNVIQNRLQDEEDSICINPHEIEKCISVEKSKS